MQLAAGGKDTMTTTVPNLSDSEKTGGNVISVQHVLQRLKFEFF